MAAGLAIASAVVGTIICGTQAEVLDQVVVDNDAIPIGEMIVVDANTATSVFMVPGNPYPFLVTRFVMEDGPPKFCFPSLQPVPMETEAEE